MFHSGTETDQKLIPTQGSGCAGGRKKPKECLLADIQTPLLGGG